MTQNDILNSYFEWLYRLVCKDRFSAAISHRRVLMYLHGTQFRYLLPKDEDRAGEGVNLRWRFICENNLNAAYLNELEGPCSVLEMMIGLAIHCEEHIMDDPGIGDRTGQWFWEMMVNLGLGAVSDDRFDRRYVEDIVNRFLDRQYEPDGKGGLFRIRNCKRDLREVEIFSQLCWYLNSIT